MSLVAVLLDKCREHGKFSSDNALAARFGVSRQVVHKWRTGESMPSDDHIAQLARCAGEDAGAWLVRVRAEKATGEAAKAWAALARRLGAAAVLAVAALIPALDGYSKPRSSSENVSYVRLRLWLNGLFRTPRMGIGPA